MKETKTVLFKSIPINWYKEWNWLKRNTARELDSDDERLKIIKEWLSGKIDLKVEMMNTYNQEIFCREVTDITEFKGLYIISW